MEHIKRLDNNLDCMEIASFVVVVARMFSTLWRFRLTVYRLPVLQTGEVEMFTAKLHRRVNPTNSFGRIRKFSFSTTSASPASTTTSASEETPPMTPSTFAASTTA